MPEYGTCGHSELNMGGCLTEATWLEAFTRCQTHGARLCLPSELMAAKQTGCSLDDKLVWTWEECAHGRPFNQRVAALGNNDDYGDDDDSVSNDDDDNYDDDVVMTATF